MTGIEKFCRCTVKGCSRVGVSTPAAIFSTEVLNLCDAHLAEDRARRLADQEAHVPSITSRAGGSGPDAEQANLREEYERQGRERGRK